MNFEIISEIVEIEVIARGTGVDARHRLSRLYGKSRWRKLKGKAWIKYDSGRVIYAEIHWFEGHGVGRVEEKIVREFARK